MSDWFLDGKSPQEKARALRMLAAERWVLARSEKAAALREQGRQKQRAAADELARLTNDMGLYGPDQEAK